MSNTRLAYGEDLTLPRPRRLDLVGFFFDIGSTRVDLASCGGFGPVPVPGIVDRHLNSNATLQQMGGKYGDGTSATLHP